MLYSGARIHLIVGDVNHVRLESRKARGEMGIKSAVKLGLVISGAEDEG
ncbi:MAG: hypothetical protein QOA17_10905 [Nitrososphaeraceae archaeon]|nr:hypothetical protein [Nitrososphaeraceae archaeon]